MRGEHGAHQDRIEQGLQLCPRHARRAQSHQRVLDRARERRRRALALRPHATDAVLVLGDIGQVRKVAERAHHLDRALVREAVEGGLKLAARRGIAFPAKRDRYLADALDGREHGLALLLADGVAEHPSDQPDIVSQRPLSIRKLPVIHWSAPFSRSRMRSSHAGWLARSAPDGRAKTRRHSRTAYFLDANSLE